MRNTAKKLIGIVLALSLVLAFTSIPAMAATVNVTSANDGTNTFPASVNDISASTDEDATITVSGTVSAPGSQVTILANVVGDTSKIAYINQKTSNVSTGAYSFSFDLPSDVEDGIYEVKVGTENNTTPAVRYFRIGAGSAPEGAEDVFSVFTVNGKTVSFVSGNTVTTTVNSGESAAIVAEPASSDITVKTDLPTTLPGKATVTATYTNGTVKTYFVIFNVKSNNTAVDLRYKGSTSGVYNNGGEDENLLNYNLGQYGYADIPYKMLFEQGIKFGTDVSTGTIAYCDRGNVFIKTGSEVLKNATFLRVAKNDGGATLATGEFFTNNYNAQGSNPAWISFVVNAPATVYVFDRFGHAYTQATWDNLVALGFTQNSGLELRGDSTGSTTEYSYKKHFEAGETVKIPSYGRPGKWANASSDSVIPYDPPIYAIVWDGESLEYEEPATIKYGDVTGDDRVNSLDRAHLARHLASWEAYRDLANPAAADLNNDGRINSLDRAIISRHLAGWTGYTTIPLAK